jgi:hypothetical protein
MLQLILVLPPAFLMVVTRWSLLALVTTHGERKNCRENIEADG